MLIISLFLSFEHWEKIDVKTTYSASESAKNIQVNIHFKLKIKWDMVLPNESNEIQLKDKLSDEYFKHKVSRKHIRFWVKIQI